MADSQPHLGRCSAPKCQPVSPFKFQGLQEALDSFFPFGGEFVQARPSDLGIPTGLEPLLKQLLCHCSLVPLQLAPLPLLGIHVSGLLKCTMVQLKLQDCLTEVPKCIFWPQDRLEHQAGMGGLGSSRPCSTPQAISLTALVIS